jgi:ribosomal protein S18 acetylase RimI-like enzyme
LTAGVMARIARPMAPGLRPVDPRRDMAGVADLIDIAFQGELDTAGRQMVREMRTFGRGGWLGYQLSRWLLPPAAHPRGFVWVEPAGIVGNASLLAVEGHSGRWVLANVAVHPEWRRQGIARALTRAAIDQVRQRLGSQLILQVAHGKPGIQEMYASLGFQTDCVRTTWTRRNHVPLMSIDRPGSAVERPEELWQAQWRFMQALYPEGLIWPFPPEVDLFQPSMWAGGFGGRVRHWVCLEGGELRASLTAQPRPALREWRLVLGCAPKDRGRLEAPLLHHALSSLPGSALVILDYPSGPADADLASLGFQPGRTLTWMSHALSETGRSARETPAESMPPGRHRDRSER